VSSACCEALESCLDLAVETRVSTIERNVVMDSTYDHEGWLWKQVPIVFFFFC
jgi:hypothetical protein